jgi:hypothetical protein
MVILTFIPYPGSSNLVHIFTPYFCKMNLSIFLPYTNMSDRSTNYAALKENEMRMVLR